MISVVDPEARHAHKSRSEYRDGYKAHIAIEPETGLVTAAALTPANAPDGRTGVELLSGEEPGLQVLADGAYGSGETLAALNTAAHVTAIKPFPTTSAVPGGFHRDDFIVDHAARTVTCPAGNTVPIRPTGGASFGPRCRGCPLRQRCTKSAEGRHLTFSPHDAELVESRRAWKDGDFAENYRRWRPMVERSIAWLVADNHRRVRFRGVERNELGLSLRVAAINLRRLVNLGWSTMGPGSCERAEGDARARVVNKGTTLRALPTWVADSNPLHVGASVRTSPSSHDELTPEERVVQQSPSPKATGACGPVTVPLHRVPRRLDPTDRSGGIAIGDGVAMWRHSSVEAQLPVAESVRRHRHGDHAVG